MPVIIRIDGKLEPWGSPRRGLSASERQEYDELHASYLADDRKLDEYLGSPGAAFREALHRQSGIPVPPERISVIERRCQSLETTRRALRDFLADPDLSLEWTWRFWVGRALGEMRGTGCVDITPGIRTSWGSDTFTHRPGLTREQRAHAEMLLEKWGEIGERLRADSRPYSLGEALGGQRSRLTLSEGGRLLSQLYAYEQQLLKYSAYPSVAPSLPLPGGEVPIIADESPPPTANASQAATTRSGILTDEAPDVLREPTDDDRANFLNEGVWNQLSRGERSKAVQRAINAAWDETGMRPHPGISLFSGEDMRRATDDGDVEAWQKVWYLCRGIRPLGWSRSGRALTSVAPNEPADPGPSESQKRRLHLLRTLAQAMVEYRMWMRRGGGDGQPDTYGDLPWDEQRRLQVADEFAELERTNKDSPEQIEMLISVIQEETRGWRVRAASYEVPDTPSGGQPYMPATSEVVRSSTEQALSETASSQSSQHRESCRGACKSFRASYAREFWAITDQKGERATHEDLARRYAVGERQVQRFIAGCPDRHTKQPRHPPLDWPPIRQ